MKRFWLLCAVIGLFAVPNEPGYAASPALPDRPTPLEELPEQPHPLLSLGSEYLASGKLDKGFELPTGAVWQPQLLVWGSLRTALQGEWGDGRDQAQWANRADLFAQLSLTPTERLVISLQPLHEGGESSGYRFGLDGDRAEFDGEFDSFIETLYFEGDFGELFPALDRNEAWPRDLGFVFGRAPVNFQDGFLIDDNMTAIGLVQNSLSWPGTSNARVSFLAAWDDVHRGGNNRRGGHTQLTGAFLEVDRGETTWAFDSVYVSGDGPGDGVFAGVSAIRRIRDRWNVTTRFLGSYALDEEVDELSDGLLGVVSLSFSPYRTHDVAYVNLFAASGRYTAASRGPTRGGPLGRIGLLFEAPGFGSLSAPLANDADHPIGGAIGYHKFWSQGRSQLIVELGGRIQPRGDGTDAWGVTARLQQALGRRVVLRFDLYGVSQRERGEFVGARSEILIKF